MSVRAYRIIKKEIADDSSFNLWHDDELLDFFKDNQKYSSGLYYSEYLDEDGNGGSVEISTNLLKKALEKFDWEKDDYRFKAIKKDVAFAKSRGDEYVLYECF